MDNKKIGFKALVKAIGENYFEQHKENAVFSWGEEDKGLYCFLGINLHPINEKITLSCPLDDWDIYASCYVINNEVIMDKCKLP